jgi:hypothetical protein
VIERVGVREIELVREGERVGVTDGVGDAVDSEGVATVRGEAEAGIKVLVGVGVTDEGELGSPFKAIFRTLPQGSFCMYVLRNPVPISKNVLASAEMYPPLLPYLRFHTPQKEESDAK